MTHFHYKGLRTSCSMVFICASLLLFYMKEHNRLIELRMYVPKLEKEVLGLEAEKRYLQCSFEEFVNPSRLEEISKRAQYLHLHHIQQDEMVHLE